MGRDCDRIVRAYAGVRPANLSDSFWLVDNRPRADVC
jgi:hypothetical protein